MAPRTTDASEELFPTHLDERRWNTFAAHGFSEPVVGVIYHDGANHRCGVPLGGVGTGYVNLDANGRFGEWTLFNDLVSPAYARKVVWVPTPVEAPRKVHEPFLGLVFGDKRWVLSLDELDGIDSPRQIHYWGHYPVADLEYELDQRVEVGLRAWSPFVPGDVAASNVPGAIFEVHVRNRTPVKQRCTLAFSFPGPASAETRGTADWQRAPVKGALSGISMSTVRPGWPERSSEDLGGSLRYEYALGVIGLTDAKDVRTGGALGNDGPAWAHMDRELPDWTDDDPGSSVAVDFTLATGERRAIRFVLTWYAPFWPVSEYINAYYDRYDSALDVAQELAKGHVDLLRRVLGWQQAVYSEKPLPDVLREALVNSFHTMTKGGAYARRPQESTDRALLSIAEAAGEIPLQETMCVAWWGDYPVTWFFPELRAGTLRTLADMQHEDGRPPFAIGTSNSNLHSPIHEAQYVVNGLLYVAMVDRLCQRVGDAALVREFYPAVKRAVEFEMTQSVYDDGLVGLDPESPKGQPFDSWEWRGNAPYIAGHWIAALHAAARMADEVGDDAFTESCRSWATRAQATLNATLWNQEVGSYLLYRAPGTEYRSDTVLVYQFDGELTRALLGLPEVFPPDRVRATLKTIDRLCVEPLTAGAANAMRPDGTPDRSGGSDTSGIWPAANAVLAAVYAVYRDHATAEEILRKSLGNLVLTRQLQWDFPQAFDTHAGVTPRASDYYWGMSVWAVPPAWSGQTIVEFADDGSFLQRVLRAGTRLEHESP